MDLFKRPLDQFDASNWAKRDCNKYGTKYSRMDQVKFVEDSL